jgi:PAS domain S-box-containing protein
VARDITERSEIQKALRESRDDLEWHVRERTSELATANVRLQREIDEHRRSQEALEQSEADLRDVFHNMPDFVVVVDGNGVIQLANRGVGGLGQEDLLGKRSFGFMLPPSQEVCRGAFEQALSTGEAQTVECHDVFGLIWDCHVIPLSHKANAQVMIICTDVTERRKTENLIQIQRDLSVALNATSNLDEALKECCKTASQVSGMDCSGVYLVNQTGSLSLAANHGVSADFAAGVCHQGTDSPLAHAAQSGRPSFYHVRHASSRNRRLLLDEGFRAVAIVPVCHEGKTIACLALASRTLEQVPPFAQNALDAIAEKIGGAISRIRAEEALRVSEETSRALVNSVTETAILLETDGTVVTLNETAAKRLGRSIPELIGRCVYDLFPRESAESRRAIGRHVIRTGQSVRVEDQRGERAYDSVVYPVVDRDGRVTRLAVYSQDVTEQRQFEKKLEAEQRLLRKLLDLQERERKLVSYEIHDGFVQDVIGAQMFLEAGCAKLRSQDQPVPEELNRVRDLLGNGLVEARRLIGELRPMIIDERGIVEAINYLVAEEASQSGLQIDFHHELHDERFDPVLEGNLFRIVQEALMNVKRHSHSNMAEVRLTQADRRLRIEIRDRGVGFDPRRIPDDRFGIRGIRERARLFGGLATIRSDAGTEITVEVPVSAHEVTGNT